MRSQDLILRRVTVYDWLSWWYVFNSIPMAHKNDRSKYYIDRWINIKATNIRYWYPECHWKLKKCSVSLASWWRHQMETFSALLALCAGNSPVSGEFPAQRPVTRSFFFFDLHLVKRLSKHSRGWWFETLSRPLWRHCNICEGNPPLIDEFPSQRASIDTTNGCAVIITHGSEMIMFSPCVFVCLWLCVFITMFVRTI